MASAIYGCDHLVKYKDYNLALQNEIQSVEWNPSRWDNFYSYNKGGKWIYNTYQYPGAYDKETSAYLVFTDPEFNYKVEEGIVLKYHFEL